jgi:hypothetical protein
MTEEKKMPFLLSYLIMNADKKVIIYIFLSIILTEGRCRHPSHYANGYRGSKPVIYWGNTKLLRINEKFFLFFILIYRSLCLSQLLMRPCIYKIF